MAKNILDSLCDYLNIKNYRELALYFEVPSTRVYSWKKYGKITDVGAILVKNPEISVEWLRTGKGEMTNVRTPLATKEIELKDLAAVSQSPTKKDKKIIKTGVIPLDEQADSLNEEEAIEQTRYVLRSNTVYRGALISNIRAFYQGVKREEEMLDVDLTMVAMQEQLNRQEETMNRMEQMLQKFLGESSTKEKIQAGGTK